MRLFAILLIAGLSLFLGRDLVATPAEDAAATIVIYNLNDPDSKGLADFYCSARSIDPAQEIGIGAPLSEEISRSDYDVTIASSIRKTMIERGYWTVTKNLEGYPMLTASRIRYAVLMKGMPLKIAECSNYPGDHPAAQPAAVATCTAASVDSELSLLGCYNTQISGVINNPLCVRKIGALQRPGKSNAEPPARPPQLLLVGRLDALSTDAVKAMILNGLKAEKEGLWGWGYVDLRSISDPNFAIGDQWIKKAGEVMRKKGIPVITDDLPETFQEGFPITDAAAYFGWYTENINGPFREASFQFVPGAVAAHLHSFSAATLHDPLKGWTGPLLQHGASASVGNVYEPYLIFTTDFGTMEEKLLSGGNLAESYYAGQPVLSWMSILVGDPLYRPYAVFQNPEAKVSNLWSDYRQIVLSHHGNVLKAAHDLGVRARATGESLYLEALGAAQSDAGALTAAGASFRDAALIAKDPKIQFRLLLEQVRVLEKRGKPEKSYSLLSQGLSTFTDPSQKALLLSWVARLNPISSPTGKPTPENKPSPEKAMPAPGIKSQKLPTEEHVIQIFKELQAGGIESDPKTQATIIQALKEARSGTAVNDILQRYGISAASLEELKQRYRAMKGGH